MPNAILVVDHFYLVKIANDAVTKVRRRVAVKSTGHRGRTVDANRRRLLKAREHPFDKASAALWNILIEADSAAQILTAWIAKDELRKLLTRRHASRREIATQLAVFYHWRAATETSELHTLIGNILSYQVSTKRGHGKSTHDPPNVEIRHELSSGLRKPSQASFNP